MDVGGEVEYLEFLEIQCFLHIAVGRPDPSVYPDCVTIDEASNHVSEPAGGLVGRAVDLLCLVFEGEDDVSALDRHRSGSDIADRDGWIVGLEG